MVCTQLLALSGLPTLWYTAAAAAALGRPGPGGCSSTPQHEPTLGARAKKPSERLSVMTACVCFLTACVCCGCAGSLPSDLSGLDSLSLLDVSGNQMSGSFPTGVWAG